MAAIIRNGNPTIFSAIVNEDNGIGGGAFVTLAESTNKVTNAAANVWNEHTYITVNVTRQDEYTGDDATAVIPKNGYIQIVHPNPGDEIEITGLTGTTTAGTAVRSAFIITGSGSLDGVTSHTLRCIMATPVPAAVTPDP